MNIGGCAEVSGLIDWNMEYYTKEDIVKRLAWAKSWEQVDSDCGRICDDCGNVATFIYIEDGHTTDKCCFDCLLSRAFGQVINEGEATK